jgi:glycosyltransferase involved in cell wall biosynthesis
MIASTELGNSRNRLLAIGQAESATGYARVLANILARVSSRFRTLHFGINYRGPILERGYKILPNMLVGDQLGRKQLPALLMEYKPDLVFLCHDMDFYSVHEPALDQFRRHNPDTSVVVYCPVEWEQTPPGNFSSLLGADCVVFYTEFGRGLLQRFRGQFSVGCPRPKSVAVIPHGIDSKCFFPLVTDDRQASMRTARADLFADSPLLLDAFIVLNANRNSPRKRIDVTLRIFAEFSRVKPDVYLYLHMGMRDSGCDVLKIARELEIENRLLLTTRNAAKPDVTDQRLNLIYNACDVGINTSTGEGWGLVAMEHAATGAPQLLPAHSAPLEVWAEDGMLIPLKQSARAHLDTTYAVRQLNLLYSQPSLLLKASERSFAYATTPKFSWDYIAGQWARLFGQYLS